MNRIWVADATENSTYFLSYDGGNSKHLKDAAASADRWAKAKASTLVSISKFTFLTLIHTGIMIIM